MINFLDDLANRSIIAQKTEKVSNLFKNECVKGYLGIDPTADSLHVGHLIAIITMKRFQLCGHKPYLLIGGATGMIGDPSFKSSERQFLDVDVINTNIESIKKQLQRFFDFDSKSSNCAEIVNNADWYSKMNSIDFLRDAGKHITVNYMTAKESVKKRIVSGISFTEFSYQLLQAYDFYYLNSKYGISLQIGGDDQWGNITTGVDFVRKKKNEEVHALTIKLLVKDDGTKFGKTESGTVWLDPQKTSPYEFYQFWLNRSDAETEEYMNYFSLKSIEEIKELIKKHKQQPELRLLQKELAKELTIFVHGEDVFNNIFTVTNIIFGNDDFYKLLQIKNVEKYLTFLPNFKYSKKIFDDCKTYYDVLSKINLDMSKSEIKRALNEGSISINKKKIKDCEEIYDKNIFLNPFFLFQRGKKKYAIVFLI